MCFWQKFNMLKIAINFKDCQIYITNISTGFDWLPTNWSAGVCCGAVYGCQFCIFYTCLQYWCSMDDCNWKQSTRTVFRLYIRKCTRVCVLVHSMSLQHFQYWAIEFNLNVVSASGQFIFTSAPTNTTKANLCCVCKPCSAESKILTKYWKYLLSLTQLIYDYYKSIQEFWIAPTAHHKCSFPRTHSKSTSLMRFQVQHNLLQRGWYMLPMSCALALSCARNIYDGKTIKYVHNPGCKNWVSTSASLI